MSTGPTRETTGRSYRPGTKLTWSPIAWSLKFTATTTRTLLSPQSRDEARPPVARAFERRDTECTSTWRCALCATADHSLDLSERVHRLCVLASRRGARRARRAPLASEPEQRRRARTAA